MAVRKAGRYELLEELGRGAMGVVYKAFDPTIGRVVAVKTMQLNEAGTGMSRPELLQRFQTEARAAGQLVHPNIVVIYDAGEDSGVFYITMEFVAGQSLQGLIDKRQPFPLPRVLRIMGQVCGALGYAHERSVVHRDVKPANIVLGPDDTVKITDFGTAKILALGTTQSGTIVGTPSYMAPEQVKGRPIDGRCDIFALGVILYELITGEKPFPGDNVTTVIYKIVNEEPINPRDIDSSVHPGLCEVIAKALAKDPDKRYQTCREFLQDLLNYRSLGLKGAPTSYDATLVVVGRPGGTAHAPEPPISQTGTIVGAPVPPAMTEAVSTVKKVEVAGQRVDSGGTVFQPPAISATSPSTPPAAAPAAAPPPPVVPPPRWDSQPAPETQTRTVPPLPRPMTLPPLPVHREPVAEEPAPESRRSYTWALVVVLLGVLAGGGYFIWPTVRETFFPPEEQGTGAAVQEKATEGAGAPAEEPPGETKSEAKPPEAPSVPKATETRAAETSKPPEAKPAAVDPAELRAGVESAVARAGYRDKVAVEVREGVARLSGTLTAREERQFRSRFRAPRGVTVEYAFTEPAAATESSPEVESRPRTARGMGEIEILTDVIGASVVLKGPRGEELERCASPCRFEDLKPGRYGVEISKDGYRTEKRIIEVRANSVAKKEISLQAAVARLQVSSTPAGADITVDGRATGQKTPATLVLAPGTRRVRVQKPGYEPYEQGVTLEENALANLRVPLTEQRQAPSGPGWVEIRTVPRGADILIDNTNTGKRTPDRLELPAGEYTLTLYLKGYQVVRERIVVVAGQTAQINKTLSQQ